LISAQKLVFLKDLFIDVDQATDDSRINEWLDHCYKRWTEDPGIYFASDNEMSKKELNAVINYLHENTTVTSVALQCTNERDTNLRLIRDGPIRNHLNSDETLKRSPTEIIRSKSSKYGGKKERITNKDIANLSLALKKLSNLRFLYLDFGWLKQLSSKALESLAESLEGLTKLEALHIDFARCGGFSDKSFEKLSDSLQRLSRLEHLHLSFQDNGVMTQKGFLFVTDSIWDLKMLNSFVLDFCWCGIEESNYLKERLKRCREEDRVCFTDGGDFIIKRENCSKNMKKEIII